MEESKSEEAMQLEIPLDDIKSEITSDNEDYNDMFMADKTCDSIHGDEDDDLPDHEIDKMILIKSENSLEADSNSDDGNYIHGDICDVQIRENDEDDKKKLNFNLPPKLLLKKQLNGYNFKNNGYNHCERYFSDEDDDDDGADEDDEYKDVNKHVNDCKVIVSGKSEDYSVTGRKSFKYNSVNDADITEFLMNQDSKDENTIINISSQNDIDTLPSSGMADKEDLLSYLYSTINVPVGRIVRYLVERFSLTLAEAEMIRKLRRRIKNRMYAKNCRIRKVRHMRNLETELLYIRAKKHKLKEEKHKLLTTKQEVENSYYKLYAHIAKHIENSENDLEKLRADYSISSSVSADANSSRNGCYHRLKRKNPEKSLPMPPALISLDKINESRLAKSKLNGNITVHQSPASLIPGNNGTDTNCVAASGSSLKISVNFAHTTSSLSPAHSSSSCSSSTEVGGGGSLNTNEMKKLMISKLQAKYLNKCSKEQSIANDSSDFNGWPSGSSSSQKDESSSVNGISSSSGSDSDDVAASAGNSLANNDNDNNNSDNDSLLRQHLTGITIASIQQKSKQSTVKGQDSVDVTDDGKKESGQLIRPVDIKQLQKSSDDSDLDDDMSSNEEEMMSYIAAEKVKLIQERNNLLTEKKRIEELYLQLCKHLFQSFGVENGSALLQMYMAYCIQLLNIPPLEGIELPSMNDR